MEPDMETSQTQQLPEQMLGQMLRAGPTAAARQVENDPEVALSQARTRALEKMEQMPADVPAKERLRQLARALHARMAKKRAEETNPSDPRQVLRLVTRWGRPEKICHRLSDVLHESVSLRLENGDRCEYPAETGREAARRLQRFAEGEQPRKIAEIGDVLGRRIDLGRPIPMPDGPAITLSFLSHDRTHDCHDQPKPNSKERDNSTDARRPGRPARRG
jgi:hypothetical protein